MAPSWNDHELSRVITSRSSAHKSLTGEFWQSSGWGRLWNLHIKQRVVKKTDMCRTHLPRRAPLCREMTGALERRAGK
jgi:hypothetical protein